MAPRTAKQLATQAEELAAVGDREGAVRCYERALRLEPHNKNYKLKLDSLHHAEEQMSVLLEKLAENKGKQHFEKVDRSENSEAETPEMLCRCAERGKLPDLKGLLKAGADANAWNPLRQGDGALHYAKDVATARVLLDAGARVEAGRRSWTPLMAHVRFGRPEVAYFLLEKGADASAVVPRREPGAGRNVVFCVTNSSLDPDARPEVLRRLLAAGAAATACELETEWTPLHDAAMGGYPAVCEILLDAGANVNAASTKRCAWKPDGYVTPLDVAAELAHDAVGELHAYAGPGGRV